jgi:hypothetical protein
MLFENNLQKKEHLDPTMDGGFLDQMIGNSQDEFCCMELVTFLYILH